MKQLSVSASYSICLTSQFLLLAYLHIISWGRLLYDFLYSPNLVGHKIGIRISAQPHAHHVGLTVEDISNALADVAAPSRRAVLEIDIVGAPRPQGDKLKFGRILVIRFTKTRVCMGEDFPVCFQEIVLRVRPDGDNAQVGILRTIDVCIKF
jgi:hypothetical protein